MKPTYRVALCLYLAISSAGCWVHTEPDHPRRHEHVERREVIIQDDHHHHDHDHDH